LWRDGAGEEEGRIVYEMPVERGRRHDWHDGYRMGYDHSTPRNGTGRYTGTIYAGPVTHRATDAQRRAAAARPRVRTRLADASAWHWLLLIPVVLPLLTPLYNRTDPALLGFPFFYWFQLALAGLSSVVIALVHLATRKRA
jgi:hypothetical protein